MAITSESGAGTIDDSRWVLAPQRELRMLIDGIRDWLTSLGNAASGARFLGVLEGEDGQGQSELLEALFAVCRELKLNVVHSGRWRDSPMSPHRCADLAADAIQAALGKDAAAPSMPGAILQGIDEILAGPPEAGAGQRPSLPPLEAGERLLDTLAHGIFDAGCVGPLVLLVEDVEGADAITREVLRRLTGMWARRRQQPEQPMILLLVTARSGSDLQETLGHPDVQAAAIEAFRVTARGCSREDLRDLTVSVLGEDLPLTLRESLSRRAAGNPRDLRWALLHSKATGWLRDAATGGRAQDLNWSQTVELRKQALSAAECLVVEILSLLHGPCESRIVLEAAGALMDDAASAPAEPAAGVSLASLEEGGWLRGADLPVGTRQPSPGSEASVPRRIVRIADQDLARVVARDLTPARRARIHAALSQALLRQGSASARWLALAAMHACDAGDASHTLTLTLQACRALSDIGCAQPALDLVERALEACPGQGPLALVRLRAELLRDTGNFREAVEAYEQALERTCGGEPRAAILRALSELHRELDEPAERLTRIEAGMEELEGLPLGTESIRLLAAQAEAWLDAGDSSRGLSVLEECQRLLAAQELVDTRARLEVQRTAQRGHYRRSSYREALELERAVLGLCEQLGDIGLQCEALEHLASLHTLFSEWTEAEVHLLRLTALARDRGSRARWARSQCLLGRFQRDRGQLEAACESLRNALSLASDASDSEALFKAGSALLGLELELGRFDRAARTARFLAQMGLASWIAGRCVRQPELETWGAQCSIRPPAERDLCLREIDKAARRGSVQARDWLLAGSLQEQGGLMSEAQRSYREAIERSGGGESLTRTIAYLGLGRVCRERGELESALRCFEHALGALGANPNHEVLALAYLEVSEVLSARGDLCRAFEHASRGLMAALDARHPAVLVRALLVAGGFLGEAGKVAAATDFLETAAELAGEFAWSGAQLHAQRCLQRLRGLSLAVPVARGDDAAWRRLAQDLSLPGAVCALGLESAWACVAGGRFEEALKLAREGIELARRLGLSPLLHEHLYLVGVVEGDPRNPRKNLLRALEALEQALAGSESLRCARLSWEVLGAMAKVFKARGKEDLAEACGRRADEIAALCLGMLRGPLRDLEWLSRLAPGESGASRKFQGSMIAAVH